MRAALAAVLLAGAAAAGEPSGLDPEAFDACLAGGDAAACAVRSTDSCVALWAQRDPARDRIDARLGCIDAEQQLWDARLNETYGAVLSRVEAARPDDAPAIREAERAWIAFRDARCRAEAALFGHGTGGILATPECRLRESARQLDLLRGWEADQ